MFWRLVTRRIIIYIENKKSIFTKLFVFYYNK